MEDNIGLIIVSAFFAIAGASMAHIKNRSLLFWVPVSALFPLIGFGLLAIMPAGEPKTVVRGLAAAKENAMSSTGQDADWADSSDNESAIERGGQGGGVSGKAFIAVILLVLVGGYAVFYQMNKAEKLDALTAESVALCGENIECADEVDLFVEDCFDRALDLQGLSRFTEGFQVVAESLQGCIHSNFSSRQPQQYDDALEEADEESSQPNVVIEDASDENDTAVEDDITPSDLADIHERVQRLLRESAEESEQAELRAQQAAEAAQPQVEAVTDQEPTRSRSDKAGADIDLDEERSGRHSEALAEGSKAKSKGDDDPDLDEPESHGKSLNY